MAKQPLYVAARSGGRLERYAREQMVERFNSVGHFTGAPEAVVELANLCLERGKGVTLEPYHNLFKVTRL